MCRKKTKKKNIDKVKWLQEQNNCNSTWYRYHLGEQHYDGPINTMKYLDDLSFVVAKWKKMTLNNFILLVIS